MRVVLPLLTLIAAVVALVWAFGVGLDRSEAARLERIERLQCQEQAWCYETLRQGR